MCSVGEDSGAGAAENACPLWQSRSRGVGGSGAGRSRSKACDMSQHVTPSRFPSGGEPKTRPVERRSEPWRSPWASQASKGDRAVWRPRSHRPSQMGSDGQGHGAEVARGRCPAPWPPVIEWRASRLVEVEWSFIERLRKRWLAFFACRPPPPTPSGSERSVEDVVRLDSFLRATSAGGRIVQLRDHRCPCGRGASAAGNLSDPMAVTRRGHCSPLPPSARIRT